MRTLTWAEAKPSIKRVIGTCSDAVALELANEAQERLLNREVDPVGAWQRLRVCVGSCCTLVWPRQVLQIKAWWLCDQPGQYVSEWWETHGWWSGGWGLATPDSSMGLTMVDTGTRCCFNNVVSTTTAPRKIQVVAQNASDNGKFITLRYLDSNGSRVYTSIDGVVQEGERLALSTTGTLTSNNVFNAGLYHVVKAVTNYPVRVYEYDPATNTQTNLLALYEPSETTPIYRASMLPGLSNYSSCCSSCSTDTDCVNNKVVTIACRLQHVPVVVDNDPFILGNLAALKLMVKSIKMEEQHELAMAATYAGMAAREIDGEIAAYLGDGMTIPIRMPDTGVWGMAVFNPV